MRARIYRIMIGILFLIAGSLACSGEIFVFPTPTIAVSPTFTLIPTLTVVPIPTLVPPTPTPEPGATYFVITSAENVNLRIQPGTLFPVSRLLAKGTQLLVLGQAPGGEWLYVQKTDEPVFGWVLAWLVDGGGHDGGPAPTVKPQASQLVTGRIVDRAGVPVSGIGFAVTRGAGPSAPRTDATTDNTGQFYAYLPLDARGQWIVSYVSVACTSNTMDASCHCIGGTCGSPDPQNITITLPYNGALSFVWR
jgi:hypothetical protein